jgi:hypothetical protein
MSHIIRFEVDKYKVQGVHSNMINLSSFEKWQLRRQEHGGQPIKESSGGGDGRAREPTRGRTGTAAARGAVRF